MICDIYVRYGGRWIGWLQKQNFDWFYCEFRWIKWRKTKNNNKKHAMKIKSTDIAKCFDKCLFVHLWVKDTAANETVFVESMRSFEFCSFRFGFRPLFWPKSKKCTFRFCYISTIYNISAHIAQLHKVSKDRGNQSGIRTNERTNERKGKNVWKKKFSGNSLMMRTTASMLALYSM